MDVRKRKMGETKAPGLLIIFLPKLLKFSFSSLRNAPAVQQAFYRSVKKHMVIKQ
jgi:hypothetical protein